ncbi:AAA family ATPase [Acidocella facilis]|uniref:AAA family ATPase n=1 Tax=Acidocella facilis TaxID=525 RepID=UPI001F3DCD1C|nr:ATP-binding protein [Acidocella facilis]
MPDQSLLDEYDEKVAYAKSTMEGAFTKQFLHSGGKYIVTSKELNFTQPYSEDFFGAEQEVPFNLMVECFSMATHKSCHLDASRLSRYIYDTKIGDKLILPQMHRDLLDVLTTDLEMFSADILPGKFAGNLVLARGEPGLGKTLTAEIYSEIMEKPLLTVLAGELGSDAKSVEVALDKYFKYSRDWDCILLLDEADVFTSSRKSDLVQNAVVAVFLRKLECFDGTMFMTTNRSDDIDDAILSRCAAVINYQRPTRDAARKIWRVLADASKRCVPGRL